MSPTQRSGNRPITRLCTIAFIAIASVFNCAPSLASAATAPNTVISNTATASYTDGNGNNYNTNSNTVTTTIQNAPSLTNVAQAAQNVAPGQIVVDTFTLTNTGNASGTFSLPSAATVGVNGTIVGYVVGGSTTCTTATPCTLANANTALAAITVATGATQTVGVEYTVSSSATAGSTVATTLNAAITQAAVGAAPAATSATVSTTDTDNIVAQTRLDIQKSVVSPTTSSATIPFTITANDGGAFPAYDLQSVKALLGTSAAGVLITDKIPSFGGTPLALSGTPTVTLNGAGTGTTATIYYSTSTTGAAGSWSTTYSSGATYIGVFLSGGSGGIELPSKPANSSGAGAVTTPEVTLNFATVQPTGSGSANSGAISNIANSVVGGNPGATGVTPIIGPFAASGEADSASPASPITGAITNTTSSSGTTPPGGASNTVQSQAYGTAGVLVGPLNAPGATGSYPAASNDGSGAPTPNLDYTALSFACGASTATTSINNGTANCVVPTAGIAFPGTYNNSGNSATTMTIQVTAPSGFNAALYNATCPATVTTITASTCTLGTQIAATTSAGGSATGSLGTVASGASGNFVVVYTPTSGLAVTPFVGIDSVVAVQNAAGNTNSTHEDLYPGGAIQLNKTASTVTNCPAGSSGQTAGQPCPGGVITYTISYTNNAPASAVGGGSNVGTEPAYAYTGLTATSGSFVITEDGTGANANTTGNNWATFTNGLNAAPTTTGPVTFSFVYSPTAGTAAGSTKFTATAGSAITGGQTGSISFAVTVK